MPEWNARQYLKFGAERTRPASDLIARIPAEQPHKILDIGCGPGNSTNALAQRYPDADILGVDSSPVMIEAAAAACPACRFALCDAENELPKLKGGFDIVFSNACIQWVPDHPRVLREAMALLNPGGVLAVQTPHNGREPIHRIIQQVVEESWPDLPRRIFYNLTPEAYYDLLSPISASVTLWETTYFHILHAHEDIMEWYRGTGLRPYLEQLAEKERPVFEREIFERVKHAYPCQADGDILFRFPRLFFLAVRSS